jgi:DNA polymerase elongation subunit (family B)
MSCTEASQGEWYQLEKHLHTLGHSLLLERSEQFLLSRFLAMFEKMDPDVIMGHQLQDIDPRT